MIKNKPFPVYSSIGQFHAGYKYVSDAVCLFSPSSGKLMGGNASFWQYLSLKEQAGESVELINFFDIPEEGAFKAVLLINKVKQQELIMQICPVSLNDEMLRLGILGKMTNVPFEEDRLKAAEAEQKALLNEVYHRVKNNLNIVISLLSLQINRISNQETRMLLLESKSRIFTLSLLQQNLYSSPRISEIEAGAYLRSLASSVLATFKPKEQLIRLLSEVEEGWLDIDTLTPLGLIAHELLSNAAVHAFSRQESGEITIRFKKLASGIFRLQVSDNGCGLPPGKEVGDYDTLGFLMVKSLGKQLNALLEINSDPQSGTTVSVEFKRSVK